jgi:hypothetical protein
MIARERLEYRRRIAIKWSQWASNSSPSRPSGLASADKPMLSMKTL